MGGCGNYDTADFAAADECCACGGGEDGDCADGDGVDSFGDGCDWYMDNESGCGACEDDDCENGDGLDSFGDGCDWYDANPSGCGSYDTADFVAADECCAC